MRKMKIYWQVRFGADEKMWHSIAKIVECCGHSARFSEPYRWRTMTSLAKLNDDQSFMIAIWRG